MVDYLNNKPHLAKQKKPSIRKSGGAQIGLSPTVVIKKESLLKKKSPLSKHVIANLFDDDLPLKSE
jgi:hypothetical protein